MGIIVMSAGCEVRSRVQGKNGEQGYRDPPRLSDVPAAPQGGKAQVGSEAPQLSHCPGVPGTPPSILLWASAELVLRLVPGGCDLPRASCTGTAPSSFPIYPMMSPIPVLPDITGDITSPSRRPRSCSGAGQGGHPGTGCTLSCRAARCPALRGKPRTPAWRMHGPQNAPWQPGGCTGHRSGGCPGWRLPQEGLRGHRPSAPAVPARWGQMCASLRLTRYIWSGFWFPSQRLPHPPQPAGGEELHIWKQSQLSRFKEILHRREENPIPRPSR